ncbi:endolytic transglycosylase MltG [Patescibacteria group bacterium]|nr:endolytic transglycosylase MltG [Patescibacteria group bacterium]
MSRTAQYIIFTAWVVGITLLGFFFYSLMPLAASAAPQQIVIEQGTGFGAIAALLADKGLIRSPKVFMAYGILAGVAHEMKPGTYMLSAASSTPAIIMALDQGPSSDIAVRIPEGSTVKDIDTFLANAGVADPGALLSVSVSDVSSRYGFLRNVNSLQGFLFPDTYRFYPKSDPKSIAEKFLDAFAQKAWPVLQTQQDPMKTLIVASLVEKEASVPHDQQMIAGIIDKRIAAGMPLQLDTTVIYVKCNGEFLTCPNTGISLADLKDPSPYNTYANPGLPPGPIDSPSLAAIQAAANPISSAYWYYLSDPKTGVTYYSKTLEEHNANRAKYLGS